MACIGDSDRWKLSFKAHGGMRVDLEVHHVQSTTCLTMTCLKVKHAVMKRFSSPRKLHINEGH